MSSKHIQLFGNRNLQFYYLFIWENQSVSDQANKII